MTFNTCLEGAQRWACSAGLKLLSPPPRQSLKASGECTSAALLPPGLSWLVPSQSWENILVLLYISNYVLFSTLMLPKPGDIFLPVKLGRHQNVFSQQRPELTKCWAAKIWDHIWWDPCEREVSFSWGNSKWECQIRPSQRLVWCYSPWSPPACISVSLQ